MSNLKKLEGELQEREKDLQYLQDQMAAIKNDYEAKLRKEKEINKQLNQTLDQLENELEVVFSQLQKQSNASPSKVKKSYNEILPKKINQI